MCELVCCKAIETIGMIGVRLAQSSELCVSHLVQLLSSDRDCILSEALVALSSE